MNNKMTNNKDMYKIDAPLKFSEIFGKDVVKERFDRKKLKYILLNWDVYENKCIEYDNGEDDKTYNPKQILERYLDKSKGTDFVDVKYKKSENSKKYGRWFAEGSLSIQNMPRKIRHTLCKGLWMDLDFKNCHPVILEQLCNHYDIECPYLHKYNQDRETLLNEIIQVEKCSRDVAKRMILRVLNGSNLNVNVDWWASMKNEFKGIANIIATQNEYEKLYKIVKKHKETNIEASTMNAVLCYFENLCLETLYKFFKDKRIIYDIFVLIFDGLQIEDNENNRKLLTTELLTEASQTILSKTGFNLDIVIKEFDEALELPEGYEKSFEDTFVIEAGDDKSASEYVIQRYKHILKKCKNRMFVKNKNIWTDDSKEVSNTLRNLVSSLDIRKAGVYNTSVYSRNSTSMDNCIKCILADDSYADDKFIFNMFMSNIYYLAFNNGIYSFKDKKLYKYEELPNVLFTKKINRDYVVDKKYMIDGKERDMKYCKQLVYDKIINPILPDKVQQKYFLYCLARALAGCFQDKRWFVGQGARDCGKGVLTLMLELAFEDFIGTFKCDNLLCQRKSGGDEAKKLSWIIPLEFCRIVLSSEVKIADGVKIDGTMIKSLASGGDKQEARQNHKDEINFKLQPTMFILCNELPDIDPVDTKENMEGFIFKSKFVSKQDIEEYGADIPSFFKLRDDNIKMWCNNDYVIDAFTQIILEHYVDDKLSMPKDIVEDSLVSKGNDEKPLEIVVSKLFKHSTDEKDRMSLADIKEKLTANGVKKLTSIKINNTFKSLQIGKYGQFVYTEGMKKEYGYVNIKYVGVKEEEE